MRELQILGTGCPKCQELAANAEAAAKELGIEYQLEKVTAVREMMKLGVMITPALVVDGEVKCQGKIPAVSEVKAWLAG